MFVEECDGDGGSDGDDYYDDADGDCGGDEEEEEEELVTVMVMTMTFIMMMITTILTMTTRVRAMVMAMRMTMMMLLAERAILAEYEEGLCYDEAALSATLNCLTAKQLLCPVCKK